jgi:predicted nucleic acid-binding protein
MVLLDTDVASYFYNDRPEAEMFRRVIKGAVPAISFITVGEILRGVLRDAGRIDERRRSKTTSPGRTLYFRIQKT